MRKKSGSDARNGLPKGICPGNWQGSQKPDYERMVDGNLKNPEKLFCLLQNTHSEKMLVYAKQRIESSKISNKEKGVFLAVIVNHPVMIDQQPDYKRMVVNALKEPRKLRDLLEKTLRKNVIDYAEQRIPGTSQIPDGEKIKFLEIIMNHPIRTGQLILAYN